MLFSYIGAGLLQTAFLLIALFTFYHAVGENFAISAAAGNQTTGIATYPYYATLATGNAALAVVLAIGFLFWTIPCMNVFMAIVQRGAFVYAFERLLPSWVGRVNPRTHTPIIAVAIMFILSLIGAAFDAYNANFATALTLANLTALGAPLVVGIAAMVLPWRRPDIFKGSPADWKIFGFPIISVCGAWTVLVVAFFMIEPFYFADQTGLSARSWLRAGTIILFVGIIVIGIVWWYIARAYHKPRGINLDLLYKTIPPD
jgi:amino acid transporter